MRRKMIMLALFVSFALALLAQKPNPAMAKLLNEFGKAGIEGTYSADNTGRSTISHSTSLPMPTLTI